GDCRAQSQRGAGVQYTTKKASSQLPVWGSGFDDDGSSRRPLYHSSSPSRFFRAFGPPSIMLPKIRNTCLPVYIRSFLPEVVTDSRSTTKRPCRLTARLIQISSEANSDSANPPVASNAARVQNRKQPHASPVARNALTKIGCITFAYRGTSPSKLTAEPPPAAPRFIASIAARTTASLTNVSASTKISISPRAWRAPALRVAAIWRLFT